MIKEIHDGFFTWYLDTDTGGRYLKKPVTTTYVVIVSEIGRGYIFRKTYQSKAEADAVYDELKSGIQKPCLLYIASNRSTVKEDPIQ